jgi:protein-tyrosine phosphatase
MFSFFRKRNKPAVNLSGLGTDMHSHLLPGIDDGSPDPTTSIELTRGLMDIGFSNFIVTPHILWDLYKNDRKSIQLAQAELNKALVEEHVTTQIRAAAEYYMDDHLDELLEKQVPLLTIKSNWVLVEFSFVSPPLNLKEKLFDLQIRGYQPVLAHPERYQYFASNKNWYDELKSAGCYFQVNLLSFTGYYGKVTQDLAVHLARKNYIDLLGTDLHHARHLHALRNSPSLNDYVQELLATGKILNSSLL